MLAFSRFYKRDFMKVAYTSELSNMRYERAIAESVFSEMRNALPPSGMAFINKSDYKLELDQIYTIIQPKIESNFVTPEERRLMEDSMLIMIQNGITFAGSTSQNYITNSKGNTRKAIYEPAFEKYLIYGDELPKVLISDLALRHMQNNFQYFTHVYEAGIGEFEMKTLTWGEKEAFGTSAGGDKSNIGKLGGGGANNHNLQNNPSGGNFGSTNPLTGQIGNLYGTLKRQSKETDVFLYEYFEGSTNKVKCPQKFSGLLDLFRR